MFIILDNYNIIIIS